jgi:hypothetical protein
MSKLLKGSYILYAVFSVVLCSHSVRWLYILEIIYDEGDKQNIGASNP